MKDLVEDLKIANDNLYSANKMLEKENKRLNNIIKEVREIFKYYGNKEDIVGYAYYSITGESLLELLEILDKENK